VIYPEGVHVESYPLVSVVTPSFNQAQFIEETLRSVELQRYRPIHQVVIDGGSTDGTVDLLKRWEEREHGPDYTFEWISERDRGHADALNKGFDRVRGEVVGWLNSDDVYFDRDAVGSAVATLQAHPDVDIVFGEVAYISENSGVQMILCYPNFRYGRALRGYMISQPTVLLRRSVTDRYRMDPELKGPIDFDFWLKIGREHKFLRIPRIQAGDRDQPARISRVSHGALMETARQVCASYGAKERPSRIESFQDLLLLRFLRIKALIHLLGLLMRGKLANSLAFPGWIDSVPKVLARQLTMRANNRTDLGPGPSPPEA
jgi:glycosyltransferase involved in cell wall biosynthesis